MLENILILLGLSLDSYIAMVRRGATMRDLSFRKLIGYSAVFALVSEVMFMIGYSLSIILQDVIVDPKIELLVAANIVFFVGVFLLTKSFLMKGFEERVDDSFHVKALIKQAAYTSIDIMVIGAAYCLYGTHALTAAVIVFLITFLIVMIALLTGYHAGAKYQKQFGVIGGALMVGFGIWMLVRILILR